MSPLHLYSEPFAKTGNITGEGFRRLLGRPALGLLQTVVREALQNSMDATLPGQRPRVVIRCRTLRGPELAELKGAVFSELPGDEDADALREELSGDAIQVLEIADFGTSGLAGPTRADIVFDGPEDPDFVNFMRNVGAARDTHQGGGTYGYGKTSLYALSRHSTILVDTQTKCGGEVIRRLMGCRLWRAFDAEQGGVRKRFTGRHWWGRPDAASGIEPVEGEEAVRLAMTLGLPERGNHETGTTIMIVSPRLEDGDEEHTGQESVGSLLLEAVLWNFWPRMCRHTPDSRKLQVSIEVEGVDVIVPEPENYPPLDHFSNALAEVRAGRGQIVSSQRPPKVLGHLSLVKGLRSDRNPAALRAESPFPKQSSHIALMRPVELVVKYVEGEAFSDARFEWGGVFVCSDDDEVEAAFADAEPPAHDDWIPDNLPKGHSKTFVSVGLKRINEAARTFANPLAATGKSDKRGPSLASTAALMGKLLESGSAKGPGRRANAGGGGGSSRGTRVSPARFSHLEIDDGRKVAVFEAELSNDGSSPELLLTAVPHLVMDGGAASSDDVDIGFSGSVLDLNVADETSRTGSMPIGALFGKVTCRVPLPDDAAVGLKLLLEEMGS